MSEQSVGTSLGTLGGSVVGPMYFPDKRITRDDVVREARERLGDRWMHQASLKGVATDCYGLITGVGLSLGVKEARLWANDPALKGYGRTPDADVLEAACRKYLDEIPIAQAGLGDILAMCWLPDVRPRHLGIVTDISPMRIVHAYGAARKVAENSIAGEWRNGIAWSSLITAAWRYRGVD